MSTLVLDQKVSQKPQWAEVFVLEELRPVEVIPLRGEAYPLLVEIWDNEDDAIYDTL